MDSQLFVVWLILDENKQNQEGLFKIMKWIVLCPTPYIEEKDKGKGEKSITRLYSGIKDKTRGGNMSILFTIERK